MLNQQLIEDMFQDEASKEQIQTALQQCSLNYTVSSRASKHKKQSPETIRQPCNNESFDILSLASSELSKFSNWLSDSQVKFQQNITSISTLLSQLQTSQYQSVSQDDLQIIKSQLFKKQNQQIKNSHCKECSFLKDKIKQLQSIIEKDKMIIGDYQAEIKEKVMKYEILQTMEDILGKVETNMLNLEIKELNNQVSALKNQKYNLEVLNTTIQRTYLFNKTKNQDLQLRLELQKSKGLSAAKNSTNSSELTRNQETIVFIDPVESDVEEWIKFFQIQKGRYMNMCKKEENDRMKALGRSFTKEERTQLHYEGRIFVIFSSIKEIWKNLLKIKQNTKNFLAVESNKNFLKDRLIYQNQSQNTQPLKDQNEKLGSKMAKLTKLNEYLQRQKQNLNEINEGLKKQMMKQNILHHKKEEELILYVEQIEVLRLKVFQYEQGKRVESGVRRK